MLQWLRPFTIASVLMLSLNTAQAADLQGKRFGDWSGVCEGQICYVQQMLSSNQNTIMVTSVGYGAGKPNPTMLIDLPASTQVKSGVQLQIDKQAAVPIKTSCTKQRCRGGVALDAALQKRLSASSSAKVVVVPGAKQAPIALPLSLKGFATALNAIKP
jgi:invasion protein IalB